MHHDVANSHSMHDCDITHVAGAMLGDWLAANTSLTHLEYVFGCRFLAKKTVAMLSELCSSR